MNWIMSYLKVSIFHWSPPIYSLLLCCGPIHSLVSFVATGSAKLQVSFIADGPTQSPSPSSSANAIQFLCLYSTGSLQPLGSSFGGSTHLLRSILGFLIFIWALVRGSPGSASSLRALYSTSAR